MNYTEEQNEFLRFLDWQLIKARDPENSTVFDYIIINNIQEEEQIIHTLVFSIDTYKSPQEFIKHFGLGFATKRTNQELKQLLLECPINYLIHLI